MSFSFYHSYLGFQLMAHSTHKLKAYTGDVYKPLVFCQNCGVEETEVSIHLECLETFYVKGVDTKFDTPYPKFVSGLPE